MAGQSVRLLGRPELRQGDRRILLHPGQITRLLVYLACRAGWVGREELTFLFWPDQLEAVARRNLRKLLHRARQREDGIEAEAEMVRWLVPTDVRAWQKALADRDWQEAFSLYRGRLLEGLENGAETEYAGWLVQERERLQRTWRDAVLGHAAERATSAPREAAELLRRFLVTDPLDEEALRLCLRCLAHAGRHDDLDRVYRDFARRLDRELGLEPGAETRDLVAELAADREKPAASWRPGPAATAPPWTPSHREADWSAPPKAGAPFVGRESELARLGEHLEQAVQGRGGAVALEGEAGIGKTRLVEEFLGRVKGVKVFVGRCFERELGAPLEPVRLALSSLGSFEPSPLADGRRFWTADPRDRSTIHQVLTAHLVQAARGARGAVLFIDDLQWADAATLEFVSYAAKRVVGEPVLILVGYRREDRAMLDGWLGHLAERRALAVIALPRLDSAETRTLVTGFAGVAADGLEALAAFVQRESEGNPFYALEVVRWLHDTAVLDHDPARNIALIRSERIPASALPDGVRTLIRARYQALGEAARATLELAAVVGRSFTFEVLESADRRDALELWEALEPLIEAGLIVALPGEQYAISHDKLRQTVYEAIGPPRRRALHARVAAALERGQADEAELAHHYLRAHAWSEAFTRLEAAAHRAESEHAWEVALEGYGRALDVVDRLPEAERSRFRILRALERLLEFMDRRTERAGTVEQMLELADRLGDRKLQAESQLRRMAVLARAGRQEEATAARVLAQRLFSELGDRVSEAEAFRELAYAAWTRSDYQGVLDASFEALALYRQLGMRRAEAAIGQNIAQAFRWLGRPDEALEWAETAGAIYQELGDLLGAYLKPDTLAWIHMHRGEPVSAVPLLERLLTICEQLGDKHLLVEKHLNLGQAYLETGRPKAALEQFRAAAKRGAETGDPRHESYPLLNAGAASERLGDAAGAASAYHRAARLLETAFTVSGVPDERIGQADALTLLAGVLHRDLGRPEEALGHFDGAETIYREYGQLARLSKLLMERGALHWRLGWLERSEWDYRDARDSARRAGELAREAAALASLGVVLREQEQHEAAVAAGREALEQLQLLGDRQAEAYVLSSLARSYRQLGIPADARACLERSLELRRTTGDVAGAAAVLNELRDLDAHS